MNIHNTTYVKDLIERCKIKNHNEFRELMQILASCIGSPCNPTKLSNTFKSVKGFTIGPKTKGHLRKTVFCRGLRTDSCIEHIIMRSDNLVVYMRTIIKGKKYINTLPQYYFQDIGLRDASIRFRQMEESHIMEDIIYNELCSRGFRVDVGQVETRIQNGEMCRRQNLEVDFVAEQGNERYHIQSVLNITDRRKMEQETLSLNKINDAIKRIVVVKANMKPYYEDNGFLLPGLFDFLLKPDMLTK